MTANDDRSGRRGERRLVQISLFTRKDPMQMYEKQRRRCRCGIGQWFRNLVAIKSCESADRKCLICSSAESRDGARSMCHQAMEVGVHVDDVWSKESAQDSLHGGSDCIQATRSYHELHLPAVVASQTRRLAWRSIGGSEAEDLAALHVLGVQHQVRVELSGPGQVVAIFSSSRGFFTLSITSVELLVLSGIVDEVLIDLRGMERQEGLASIRMRQSEGRPHHVVLESVDALFPTLELDVTSTSNVHLLGSKGDELIHVLSLPLLFGAHLEIDSGEGEDYVQVADDVSLSGMKVTAHSFHTRSGICPLVVTSGVPHTVNTACDCTGPDGISITAPSVIVTASGSLTTVDGDLSIIANGADATGLRVDPGRPISTVSGALTIDAQGTSTGISFAGDLTSQGLVMVTGRGQGAASSVGIDLEATATWTLDGATAGVAGSSMGTAGAGNTGVQTAAGSAITGGAALSVTGVAGTGSGDNVGVSLLGGVDMSAALTIDGTGGAGTLTGSVGAVIEAVVRGSSVSVVGVGGDGGGGDHGVTLMGGGQVEASSGGITITGTGGEVTAGEAHGVEITAVGEPFIAPAGQVVAITGNGGGGSGLPGSHGVSWASALTAATFDLQIAGFGRSLPLGSDGIYGVNFVSGSINLVGDATLSVSGTGGQCLTNSHGVNMGPVSLSTNTGDLSVTGVSLGSQTGSGIVADNGSFVTAGVLTLDGTGSLIVDIASADKVGVRLAAPATVTLGSTGSIVIFGRGGEGSGSHGVTIQSVSFVGGTSSSASVTGITLGQADASFSNSHGVAVMNLVDVSNFLSFTLSGTGAPVGGSRGILVDSGATLQASGAPLTLTGAGGGEGGSALPAFGVDISGTITTDTDLNVTGTGGSSSGAADGIFSALALNSSGGDVTLTGTGGAVGSSCSGITGAFSVTAASDLSITGTTGLCGAGSNVGLLVNAPLSGATIDIVGDGGMGANGGNHGVEIASSLTSGSTITVTGRGGGAASVVAASYGILIQVTGSFSSPGLVTLDGTGGAENIDGNYGVEFPDFSFTSDVTVVGTGRGSGPSTLNHGVFFNSVVSTTGNAVITCMGGIGSGSRGCLLASSTLTATDVTLTGTGGTEATGTSLNGVEFAISSSIVSSGVVSVIGFGGPGNVNCDGVRFLTDAFAGTPTSVTIVGTGGAATGGGNNGVTFFGTLTIAAPLMVTGTCVGSTAPSLGVRFAPSTIITADEFTILGTAGVGALFSTGVAIEASTAINSLGGVTITGTGGSNLLSNGVTIRGVITAALAVSIDGFGGTGGDSSVGITVDLGGEIHASDISLNGIGGSSGNFCHGVVLASPNVLEVTGTALSITGTGGDERAATSTLGISLGSLGLGTTSGATITLIGNSGLAGLNGQGIALPLDTIDFGPNQVVMTGVSQSNSGNGFGLFFVNDAIFRADAILTGTGAGGSGSGISLAANVMLEAGVTSFSMTGVGSVAGGIFFAGGSTLLDNTGINAAIGLTGSSSRPGAQRGGVQVDGIINAVTSTVTVTGNCDATAAFCAGVLVRTGELNASGTGRFIVIGTAGGGLGDAGVTIEASGRIISATPLSITGTAMFGVQSQFGIESRGILTASELTLTGESIADGSVGLHFLAGSTTTVSGLVDLTGMASDLQGNGIRTEAGAVMDFTGAADATLTGTSSGGATTDAGILLSGTLTMTRSGGSLLISGTSDGVQNSHGIVMDGTVTSNRPITLQGTSSAVAGTFTNGIFFTGGTVEQTDNELVTLLGSAASGEGIRSQPSLTLLSAGTADVIVNGDGVGPQSSTNFQLLDLGPTKAGGNLIFQTHLEAATFITPVGPYNIDLQVGGTLGSLFRNTGATTIDASSQPLRASSAGDLTVTTSADVEGSLGGPVNTVVFEGLVIMTGDVILTGGVTFMDRLNTDGSPFLLSATPNVNTNVRFEADVGDVSPPFSFDSEAALLTFCCACERVTVLDLVSLGGNSLELLSTGDVLTMVAPAGVTVTSTVTSASPTMDWVFENSVELASFNTHIYQGLITMEAGGLINSFFTSAAVHLASPTMATIAGFGAVGGLLQDADNELAPGDLGENGCFFLSSLATLSGNVDFSFSGTATPCTDYDQLRSTSGTLDLTGATMSLTMTGAPLVAGDYLFLTRNVATIISTFVGLPEYSFVPGCANCLISYRVDDTLSLGTGISVHVNTLPVGMPDMYTVSGTMATAISPATGVLANDVDPDVADDLVVILVTDILPDEGQLTLLPDGSFTYDPMTFHGAEVITFEYEVMDNFGSGGVHLVTLDVGPNGPTPTPTVSFTRTTTRTPAATGSPTSSVTPTRTTTGAFPTPSATSSVTPTRTPTETSSRPPSASLSSTVSPTTSRTPSRTISPPVQPSQAVGPSIQPTAQPSASPTLSPGPTIRNGGFPQPTPAPGDNDECVIEPQIVLVTPEGETVFCENGDVAVILTTDEEEVEVLVAPGDRELIRRAGEGDVISPIIDLTLPNGGPLGEVEICLSVARPVVEDSCLAFIDESKRPAEWRCEDSCLEYRASSKQACGNTDHFTNFAVLFDGGEAEGKPCGSRSNDYITGRLWGDLLLAGLVFGICVLIAVVFALTARKIRPVRNMVYGPEGSRIMEMRSTNADNWRKSLRINKEDLAAAQFSA